MTAAARIPALADLTCKHCGRIEVWLDTRGPECGLCDDCSELWKLCDGCNTYKPSEAGGFEGEAETLTDSVWVCGECADEEHREQEALAGDGRPVAINEAEEWR